MSPLVRQSKGSGGVQKETCLAAARVVCVDNRKNGSGTGREWDQIET